ncbi:MAG: NUDIX hydrolase N-terminal domain-containing protein [Chitinophagaceae bacterium]
MDFNPTLELAKRIKAIAQIGLTYSLDEYNIERYKELETISHQLIREITGVPLEKISNFYIDAKEYPTSKTDIRAVIFNDQHEILLVQEKSDNNWSLPGGWAEIGFSPKEVAVKEVAEETGLVVTADRLLAVLDKKHHAHPAELTYVYKYFIRCSVKAGTFNHAHDINNVSFFRQQNIPVLSENRVLRSQIDLMFEFLYNPDKEVVLD